MNLIVRGSEYQDFLTCRKKWYHAWVEEIEPVRPDNKLFFGNVIHKWLEFYYNNGCDKLMTDLLTSAWINDQDMSGMEQTEIDEQMKLLRGVTSYYHETYGESDKNWKVIATEMEFIVKLDEGVYMTGTIDLVYEVDGKIRFADHKSVSSISMYEEKAKMDRQISRYWWALKMIAAGIAEVKNKVTGKWETSQVLLGKEIDGFDYNIIAKDYPREPKILKSGKLSTDKAQKTTYKKYFEKIVELNLNENDYTEMLNVLQTKQDPFLRRVNVQRNSVELESAAWEFMYTAGDIHDVKLMVTTKPESLDMLTYRNIGTHCEHMCQFKALCQTIIEGGNISLTKSLAYRQKTKEVKTNGGN